MGELVLPASPNWYCSKVSDCTTGGLFLYGAKNCVYVLDVSENAERYVGHFVAHAERVVGLSTSRSRESRSERRVATAGEDGRVRLWDYHSFQPALLVDEHANHQNKPTALDWSDIDPDVIVSGDDRGVIVVWNSARGDIRQMSLERTSVYCLQCSPHHRFHLAVGYKSGLILIVDISGPGVIIQRLRGHDDEIHCVTWCPTLGEDLRQREDNGESNDIEADEATFSRGCLLASGSRDRMLRVWSTDRGRCILSLKVPSGGGRRDRYDDQKLRIWLTLMWMKDKPCTLVSSSITGDLYLWDLRRPGKNKYDVITPASATRGHQRIVFNLSSPECTTGGRLVSISMDRQVIVWHLNTRAVTMVPTLGGFVYCLALSPLNPGRLAVGVGDNMIRVWNTSNRITPYDSLVLWQGIKAKVTTLCWHPEREGLLAFGTDEGRVGIYDILSNRPPRVSSTYHQRTVYVVTWGPTTRCRDDPNQTVLSIYSCGDGRILEHHPNALEATAINIEEALDRGPASQGHRVQHSEISWKPDFSALAIGNEDGSIEIFTFPNLRLVVTLQVHRKLINVIRWHPLILTDGSPATGGFEHWIATGSNEASVRAFDLEPYFGLTVDSVAPLVTDASLTLEGHTNRVTDLAWSPHCSGYLVSSSYDGTAEVWCLPEMSPVANFRGHTGRLFSVAWSLDDHEVIYTGADDHNLISWRISKQTHTVPPTGSEKRKSKPKHKNKTRNQDTEKTQSVSEVRSAKQEAKSSVEMAELQMLLERKRQELKEATEDVPDQSEVISTDSHITGSPQEDDTESEAVESAPVKKEIKDAKKRRVRSLFPLFSSSANRRKALLHEDCTSLAQVLCDPQDDDDQSPDPLLLGMYGSRRHMYELVQKEAAHHQDQANLDHVTLLHVWTGDLSTTLQTAATKGQLTDWLMAMAPTVSPHRWRDLCECYADQLQREGQVTKAATFLISAGKTTEAIDMLQQKKLYKEALSLAKLRLSPHDACIRELYLGWAEQLTAGCCHEQAAKCYLAVGRPLDAAKALVRRSDLSALRAAVEITRMANETSAYKAYGLKYIQECELCGDWMGAAEVIAKDDMLRNQSAILLTHEILVRQLTKLDLYSGCDLENSTSALTASTAERNPCLKDIPKFLMNPAYNDPLSPWPLTLLEEEPVVLYVIRAWLQHNIVDLRAETLNALYLQLSTQRHEQLSRPQGKQLLIDVALDVTLGILCLLLANKNMAASCWVVAMETCHRMEQTDLLQGLCRLLLPQGRFSLDVLQQQVIAIRMIVLDDPTASSPLPANKPSVTNPRTPGEGGIDLEPVSSTSSMCTVAECMLAFYGLAVLNQWRKDISEQRSPGADSNPQGRSDCKGENVPNGEDVGDATTEGGHEGERSVNVSSSRENVLTETTSSGTFTQPSMESLLEICRLLLSDIQVKRSRLLATLEEIEKAAKLKHVALRSRSASKTDLNTQRNGAAEQVPKRLLSCSSLPILRTPSGEYLNMEAEECTEASDAGGTQWTVGSGSEDEEEATGVFRDSDKTETGDSESKNGCVNGLGGDGDGPQSPIIRITSAVDETSERQGSECRVDTEVTEATNGEPWLLNMVDKKYQASTVSLEMLDEDQLKVSKDLLEMAAFVASCPFPDPLKSADLLLQFLKQPTEGSQLFDLVLDWATKNSFLTRHAHLFRSHRKCRE